MILAIKKLYGALTISGLNWCWAIQSQPMCSQVFSVSTSCQSHDTELMNAAGIYACD